MAASLEAKRRLKLAVASFLQLLSLAFLFFSPTMMFLMLPFASSGFIVVILVIYCKFKRGLYYSLAVSSFLLVLNIVPLGTLLWETKQWGVHWHRIMIYAVSVAINVWAIHAALRLLGIGEPAPPPPEEKTGFLTKLKARASRSVRG
ncbi:hypothetical protein T484DRAFT_1966740 [Baffinella frigidus]|nr:hypothetical protein T484DRAFT_1966740 [Cryptophyta sp. CCMP2293]|mmetsp:Transcript_11157/g.24980  ORF Transcript_11157/g.24980 Transcript_11157/m.24980 type:complete len:147 (+) Transcript_11157:200-640(+)